MRREEPWEFRHTFDRSEDAFWNETFFDREFNHNALSGPTGFRALGDRERGRAAGRVEETACAGGAQGVETPLTEVPMINAQTRA